MYNFKFSKGMPHKTTDATYCEHDHKRMHREILAKPLGYLDPTPDFKNDRRWVSPTSLHLAKHQDMLPSASHIQSTRMAKEYLSVLWASTLRPETIGHDRLPMTLTTDIDFGGFRISKDSYEIPEKFDFMTDKKSFLATQDGYPIKKKQKITRGPINRFGDLAHYVSKDKMEHWFAFHALMKQERVPLNDTSYHHNVNENEFDFVIWGNGTACKLMMDCVMQGMYEGGYSKYSEMRARPEEYGGAIVFRPETLKNFDVIAKDVDDLTKYLGQDLPFLPMMSDGGSPYHPSRYAWHYFANAAAAAFSLSWYDQNFVLSNGKTVREEILRLKVSIAMARTVFGVHYPSDNAWTQSASYESVFLRTQEGFFSTQEKLNPGPIFHDDEEGIHENPELIFDTIVKEVIGKHRNDLPFATCEQKWNGLTGKMAA